jgi:hypothetical protein
MMDGPQAHAHLRKQWRFGRVFIPIWIVFVALLTAFYAADIVWDWGWNASWRDVLLGLVGVAFGFVFWLAWDWMFKVLEWLTDILIGPDLNK